MKTIIICADTNDGDYIHNIEEITDEAYEKDYLPMLNRVREAMSKVAELHKGKHYYNWATSDYRSECDPSEMYKDHLSEENIDFFGDLVPYGEYGVHTIKSVRVLNTEEVMKF